MASKIFISYRRDDSAGHAGRVHDRLEKEFGRDLLFMDVDAIPLGVDFVKMLNAEVAKCDILLAVIGPNWLDTRDEDGNRRLDSENDFVRIEIAAALKRDIPVIPILLEGTSVPKAARLPEEIKDLSRRNGLNVRHASFHRDMNKLVSELRETSFRYPLASGVDLVSALRVPAEVLLRAEGRIKVDAPIVHGAPDGWFKPGAGKTEWFKDHELGPEMVVVPGGEFAMGSSHLEVATLNKESGTDWYDWEGPQHNVRVKAPFAVGRFAITFDEWDACVADGGCRATIRIAELEDCDWDRYHADGGPNGYLPSDEGWGRGRRPVINVSYDYAVDYIEWLSWKTGKSYRLLSEAEWEYVARAGTATSFWWGDTISTAQANYDDAKGEYLEKTVPVDSFKPNPFGLYNVHGNVWEWCEDVWHENYKGAPTDGSAWVWGGEDSYHVVRGGSWGRRPLVLRAASRNRYDSDYRAYSLGFRVARMLTP